MQCTYIFLIHGTFISWIVTRNHFIGNTEAISCLFCLLVSHCAFYPLGSSCWAYVDAVLVTLIDTVGYYEVEASASLSTYPTANGLFVCCRKKYMRTGRRENGFDDSQPGQVGAFSSSKGVSSGIQSCTKSEKWTGWEGWCENEVTPHMCEMECNCKRLLESWCLA